MNCSTLTKWICSVLLLTCGTISAETIHVPGDYSTINGAINQSSPGDTILVADGIYTGYGNRNNFYDKA